MGKIFDIRLEMQPLTELFERAKAAGDRSVWDELTREKARSVAEFAMKRMSEVLAPGHQFKVGATGRASENLDVIESETSLGYASYGIIEKQGYKANYFIRRGFKGVKSSRHIPIDKIKEWAAAKGVNLYDPATDPDSRSSYSRYVRQRVGRGSDPQKYYVRRLRASETHDIGAGIYALAQYIEHNGSKKSHWNDLYPGSAGRFDYVVYVLHHEQAIRRALKRAAGEMVLGYVEYVASGKRKATERMYDVSKLRERR